MDKISIKKLEDGIAIVKICCEETLNALNREVLSDIKKTIIELSGDDSIKVIILSGSGKAFVAGADIKEMATLSPEEAKEFSIKGSNLFLEIERLNKVTIAAINGYALGGGCELAMSCDIRIASEKAFFGQPEIKLGIIPGFGGCCRLPRIVGIGKAKELIFSGKIVSAHEAKEIGLVEEVVHPDKLEKYSIQLARSICEFSLYSLKEAKRRINESSGKAIEESIILDAESFASCFSNGEQKEGMKAFLEKRKPAFK